LDFSAFERALVDDLIPCIDANFRTIPDQPHRAMAGLSMGGMQTRAITLSHLDTFSHIGVFRGGSIALTNITDMAAFTKNVKLVFVSYGSRELGTGSRAGFGRIPRRTLQRLNRQVSRVSFMNRPRLPMSGNPGVGACANLRRCSSRIKQASTDFITL
jgi:predicted alpha/beta superfamily hydrolase